MWYLSYGSRLIDQVAHTGTSSHSEERGTHVRNIILISESHKPAQALDRQRLDGSEGARELANLAAIAVHPVLVSTSLYLSDTQTKFVMNVG